MFSNSELYKEDIEYISNFNLEWDMLRNSTILITGATGLIGTVLVDAIMHKNNQDHLNVKVLAMGRSRDRLTARFAGYANDPLFVAVESDITERITIDNPVDYIINLASNTHPKLYAAQPVNTIDTIVRGTKNILDFASVQDCKRVINASSVEIYGENRGDVERFVEDYCGYINCNTLRAGYTEGKRLSESFCQAYINEKNLDVLSARLGRVYGATVLGSDSKAATQFIRNAVNGKDITLKSAGNQEYSFVYAPDCATALLLLLTKGKSGEAYNISDDEVKTLRETAEILATIGGTKVVIDAPDNLESKGFSVVTKALMDSSKIKSLGWQSNHSLSEGLDRTVTILKEF